ncbi:CHAP domain-containing protein [Nocardia sp. NBC_00508]|uniref:CHAP domain-containing protein n=1 Tax=Nocardia sp. NBC_00508 TaxID=2975992 RepID=UPI002E822467|nr:CHAP domain-containing protein [Nocardia sp. NBC_00508]WUD64233.1 CHAP domain-containing protein [Nocardia sp. NBC_00508]
MTRQLRSQRARWIALALVLLGVAAAGNLWWQRQSAGQAVVGERLTEFPALDRSALDPTRAGIVAVAEREFGEPGAGTKYAEGADEAWCADFVSWVLRAAGAPLVNPNSGSWRIPGVYTLQEYYESTGRFVPIESGYQPRTGDVLLYAESSPFGQHTNIVLRAEAGQVTTIGGNEFDEVRIHRFTLADVPGVVGFGQL